MNFSPSSNRRTPKSIKDKNKYGIKIIIIL